MYGNCELADKLYFEFFFIAKNVWIGITLLLLSSQAIKCVRKVKYLYKIDQFVFFLVGLDIQNDWAYFHFHFNCIVSNSERLNKYMHTRNLFINSTIENHSRYLFKLDLMHTICIVYYIDIYIYDTAPSIYTFMFYFICKFCNMNVLKACASRVRVYMCSCGSLYYITLL